MSQPSEQEIEKLLSELQAAEAFRRKAAAEALGELEESSERMVRALEAAALNDTNKYARAAAAKALQAPVHRPYVTIAIREVVPPPDTAPVDTFKVTTGALIGAVVGLWLVALLVMAYGELPFRREAPVPFLCALWFIAPTAGGAIGGLLARGLARRGRSEPRGAILLLILLGGLALLILLCTLGLAFMFPYGFF